MFSGAAALACRMETPAWLSGRQSRWAVGRLACPGGNRQRGRVPAVVLVARLPGIPPRHSGRMLALLGEAGVVDVRSPHCDCGPAPEAALPTHDDKRGPCDQSAFVTKWAAADGRAAPAGAPFALPLVPRSCAHPAKEDPCGTPPAAPPSQRVTMPAQASRASHCPRFAPLHLVLAIHCSFHLKHERATPIRIWAR
jgi:hypothetical protein